MRKALLGLGFLLAGLTSLPAVAANPIDCPAIPGTIIGVSGGKCYYATVNPDGSLSASGTFSVIISPAATGTPTNISGSATSVTLLAANANRRGATFFNDSTASLYMLFGTTAASTTNFSVRVDPNGYLVIPTGYSGQINGIWTSATGTVRVTELTP